MVLPVSFMFIFDQGDIHYTMAPPNALQQMRVLWKLDGESQILLKVVNGTWLECPHFWYDWNKTGYCAQIFIG